MTEDSTGEPVPGPRRASRLWLVAAVLALPVLAAAYLASPLLALVTLRSAAETGDIDTLQQSVDWPSVRTSLERSAILLVRERLDERTERRGGNPGIVGRLGRALAPALVATLVERYASPEGAVKAFRDRDRVRVVTGHRDPRDWFERIADTWRRLEQYRFVGPTRVAVQARGRGAPPHSIAAVLELDGWRWIVREVRLLPAGRGE
jgi:hypothetical protein